MQNLYVRQLKQELQIKIKDQLIIFFKEDLDLNDDELKNVLELAMNSRINDLEDTIDIKKILS